MRRFVVVTCVRNTRDKLIDCLASLQAQEYDNFTVVVIDDASADGSFEVAARRCTVNGWELRGNTERKGAVVNQWQAIHLGCTSPDDVVVWVDGDDRLARPDTFEILNRHYDAGALVTYGSYKPDPPSATCAPARPYPERVVRRNLYRRCPERHAYNHLRTASFSLIQQMTEDDCKDDHGEWFTSTPDAVFMFPLLELARGQVAFVPETLLIYSSDMAHAEWRDHPERVDYVNRTVLARPPKVARW